MQREGIFREMKMRDFYEKPSQKRARERQKPFAASASWPASGRSAKALSVAVAPQRLLADPAVFLPF
jgi:hypothetical protein